MLTKPLIIAATGLVALTAAGKPDVTTLAQRATGLVHSTGAFRKAVLLEADGAPLKGSKVVRSADGIATWRFVFDNTPSGNKYKSVAISVKSGRFGKPTGNISPFLQDQRISPVPKMKLARAIALLNAAGYTKGFSAVALRKPNYPGVTHPEYIFPVVGKKIVAVDTETGKVTRIG